MRKSLFALLSVLGLGTMNAQNTGNHFCDNWSLGINGGIVSPLTHSAFIRNSRAAFGIDINKQLSPIYGLTLESNATVNTQSRMTGMKSNTAIDAFNLMLLNRLNLNNIFKTYNGEPALFEVEAVGGFGWLRLNNFYTTGEGANHLASKAGLNFNFNLGESKAWTVSLKPAMFWDMSMWDSDYGHSHPNWNANYANWEIMAGVTYHFKNCNGEHYMTNIKPYDAAEVNALNASINRLRSEAAQKDNQNKQLADQLRKQQQKSADLEKALRDCEKKGPVTITKTNEKKTLESVVTFGQGKITIDASQRPNVERIATFLRNHKDAKVDILGYASPEGSIEINTRIANQRAEAVKKMLVERYRIAENRISAKGQGVGNMFEEPDWNRVSICTINND